MLRKLVHSHRVIWTLGYRHKGKNSLIPRKTHSRDILFSFSRTERNSSTIHSEIHFEVINGGKSHRTEVFSVVGLQRVGVKPLSQDVLVCQMYCILPAPICNHDRFFLLLSFLIFFFCLFVCLYSAYETP